MRDAEGKPIAGMGISTDVMATKVAFEELRRAEGETAKRESELRAILDAMPVATFIAHDPECHTMTSSRFAYELLRLPHGSNSSKSAQVEQRPSFKVARHCARARSSLTWNNCLLISSRPAQIQSKDFLVSGIPRKDRRAIGRDIDLSSLIIDYAVNVFQAGDGLYLMIGKSITKDLWVCALSRVIEILVI